MKVANADWKYRILHLNQNRLYYKYNSVHLCIQMDL